MYIERWATYFVNPEECHKADAIGRHKESYQPPDTWKSWGSRYPFPGAFAYNHASPSYNASIITLDGKQFLAMEAPTKDNLNRFCQLFSQYHVTDLVRLTPAISANKENSFPYWEGHINIHPATGRSTIELGGGEINYYATDCWENHEGLEPNRLIALVKAVMENGGPNSVIAVHCRAGVGRTGTFLAAYELIQKIDEQIAHGVAVDNIQISIDKIVWELSLQRPFMITHFSQYVALYQLVSSYTESLKTNRAKPSGVL
jgi:protein tyrosine phosphatase